MVALISPDPLVDLGLATEGDESELIRQIDSKTFRQVRDLDVYQKSGRVILRGRSESYYVKQLATHAVLDLYPGVIVKNEIDVMK